METDGLLVPYVANKYSRSWPKHDHGLQAEYVPISTVLTRRFATDGHFFAYSVPAIPRRLGRDAPALSVDGVPMVALVFDVDSTAAHRHHRPASDKWFERQRAKIVALLLASPGGVIYRTRGGYRILYRLAEPHLIRGRESADGWKQLYFHAL